MYKAELRFGQGKCISHGGRARIRAALFALVHRRTPALNINVFACQGLSRDG